MNNLVKERMLKEHANAVEVAYSAYHNLEDENLTEELLYSDMVQSCSNLLEDVKDLSQIYANNKLLLLNISKEPFIDFNKDINALRLTVDITDSDSLSLLIHPDKSLCLQNSYYYSIFIDRKEVFSTVSNQSVIISSFINFLKKKVNQLMHENKFSLYVDLPCCMVSPVQYDSYGEVFEIAESLNAQEKKTLETIEGGSYQHYFDGGCARIIIDDTKK